MSWTVEEFTVTPKEAEFSAMRAAISFSARGRRVPAGTYRSLRRDGKVIMSDTPSELADLSEFKRRAEGRVLINGLGLGCAVKMALAKPEVDHVTVVEIDREVIELIIPTFGNVRQHHSGIWISDDGRLMICQGDAFTWRPIPGVRYDVVWHDIFDDICSDNIPEMKRLHRRYGRLCDWQGSWCRAECEWLAKEEGIGGQWRTV